MKFDVNVLRYLSKEEFRVLTAVEMGMKNHEIVPSELVERIASLKRGGAYKALSTLLRHKLVHHDGAKYDGYRLTNLGYDFLGIKALVNRGAIVGVGRQIGVGKESDIYEVEGGEGEVLVLKLHRLGRISFRNVKEKRDYLRNKRAHNWLYLSRLAALKEFAFMKALGDHGLPVPQAIDCNRHCVLMSRVYGYPLVQVKELVHPQIVFDQIMRMIVRLTSLGLIHCDLNEFNLMVDDEERVTLIDFPQMVSVAHRNSRMYFERDVECIFTFFGRRYNFVPTRPSFLPASIKAEATSAVRFATEHNASDHAATRSNQHTTATVASTSTSTSTSACATTGTAVSSSSSSLAQPLGNGQAGRAADPAVQRPASRGTADGGMEGTEATEGTSEGRDSGEANEEGDEGEEVEGEEENGESEGEEGSEVDEDAAVWRPDFTTVLALGRGLLGEVVPVEGEASEGHLSDHLAGMSLAKQLAASGFTKQNEADLHAYLEDAILHRQDGDDSSACDARVEQHVHGEGSDEEEEAEDDEGDEESGEEGIGDEQELGKSGIEGASKSMQVYDVDGTGRTGEVGATEVNASADGDAAASDNTDESTANATPLVTAKGMRKQRKQAARAVQAKSKSGLRSRNSTKDKGGRRSRHVRGGGGTED